MATIASLRAALMAWKAASRASLHSLHPEFTPVRSRPPSPVGEGVPERSPVNFRPFSIPDGVTVKSALVADSEASSSSRCQFLAPPRHEF
jgi:hypothetical protein